MTLNAAIVIGGYQCDMVGVGADGLGVMFTKEDVKKIGK